jgi:hypothetical protein
VIPGQAFSLDLGRGLDVGGSSGVRQDLGSALMRPLVHQGAHAARLTSKVCGGGDCMGSWVRLRDFVDLSREGTIDGPPRVPAADAASGVWRRPVGLAALCSWLALMGKRAAARPGSKASARTRHNTWPLRLRPWPGMCTLLMLAGAVRRVSRSVGASDQDDSTRHWRGRFSWSVKAETQP